MSFFSKDYNQFFKDLAANNNKEWFDVNRKRYEENVKIPFLGFVEHLINSVKKNETKFSAEASKCIFRVNRDIRFSKDKTPYKTQMSAVLSDGGKKNMAGTGIYFELGPEAVRIYGGVYMPEKDQLNSIRNYISKNVKEFDRLINDKNFLNHFGEILGEKSKILPPEVKKISNKHPLIYNKAFYFMAENKPMHLVSNKLDTLILDHYYAAEPLNTFFYSAMKD
jgi:uncharacterized protein (TIGR02453 family)